ncbi:hypothetical protein AVEN_70324-1, partial [Araneus ventricosus]
MGPAQPDGPIWSPGQPRLGISGAPGLRRQRPQTK